MKKLIILSLITVFSISSQAASVCEVSMQGERVFGVGCIDTLEGLSLRPILKESKNRLEVIKIMTEKSYDLKAIERTSGFGEGKMVFIRE